MELSVSLLTGRPRKRGAPSPACQTTFITVNRAETIQPNIIHKKVDKELKKMYVCMYVYLHAWLFDSIVIIIIISSYVNSRRIHDYNGEG